MGLEVMAVAAAVAAAAGPSQVEAGQPLAGDLLFDPPMMLSVQYINFTFITRCFAMPLTFKVWLTDGQQPSLIKHALRSERSLHALASLYVDADPSAVHVPPSLPGVYLQPSSALQESTVQLTLHFTEGQSPVALTMHFDIFIWASGVHALLAVKTAMVMTTVRMNLFMVMVEKAGGEGHDGVRKNKRRGGGRGGGCAVSPSQPQQLWRSEWRASCCWVPCLLR